MKKSEKLRKEAADLVKEADQIDEDELNKKPVTRKEFEDLKKQIFRLIADIESLRARIIPAITNPPDEWPRPNNPQPFWQDVPSLTPNPEITC